MSPGAEEARAAAIEALVEIVDNDNNPTGVRITAAREILLATADDKK